MCLLSIKVPIRKKSGNLFKDTRKYIKAAVFLLNTFHSKPQINFFLIIFVNFLSSPEIT